VFYVVKPSAIQQPQPQAAAAIHVGADIAATCNCCAVLTCGMSHPPSHPLCMICLMNVSSPSIQSLQRTEAQHSDGRAASATKTAPQHASATTHSRPQALQLRTRLADMCKSRQACCWRTIHNFSPRHGPRPHSLVARDGEHIGPWVGAQRGH
jgi:hypothetical protein